MTLLRKPLNLILVVMTIATVLSAAACSEQEADDNQVKTAVPPVATVTEDKIAQLQREAQSGNSDAQYNLAYMYENGIGVPKNEAKALELYQLAADQGHSEAQTNLDAMSSVK